jgi:hypothetical protein
MAEAMGQQTDILVIDLPISGNEVVQAIVKYPIKPFPIAHVPFEAFPSLLAG